MQDGKIIAAWLFQKYEGGNAYGTGVVRQLNSTWISTMVVYLEKRSDAPNLFAENGCRVEYLASKGAAKFFNPILIFKLAKFLRGSKVDILHCHRHKAIFYGTLAAFIAKTPVVLAHVHGLNRTRTLVRRLFNSILLPSVTKLIAVSEAVKSDILASNPTIAADKVVTLLNSIEFPKYADVSITSNDARQLLGVPPDAFVFGTVGRLAPTKGQRHLIEAFAKVKDRIANAHLVLVGTGPLENTLKHQAQELGVFNSVTFAGFRDDVPQILRAFDCFVFPSVMEGLGCALMEAMAASLPCIAADVGGIAEILSDNIGYLVKSDDSEALKDAMLSCANLTKEARQEMGQRAKNHIAQFGEDNYLKKLQQLYTTLLAKDC